METKYKNILEFNKIQDMLADCTTNEISREMVYKLEPSSHMEEVAKLQEELAQKRAANYEKIKSSETTA